MAKLVFFSGCCNSGKTTTLRAVAEKLQILGYEVKILDEIIRKEIDKPIDEIRKNANAYLQLQNKIIRAKIEQEENALADTRQNVIYLADRAATDSMFYLDSYVDKCQLDEKNIELFCELHFFIHRYLKRCLWRSDVLILEFKPISIKEQSIFRPANLRIMQRYESISISHLNSFYGFHNVKNINMNYMSIDDVVNIIKRRFFIAYDIH